MARVMKVMTGANANVEEEGLFLTLDEMAILLDVLDYVDESDMLDQEFALVTAIRDSKYV